MQKKSSSKKLPYSDNLKKIVIDNDHLFRRVLYTVPKKFQLVQYRLKGGESIHNEVHKKGTQFLYIVSGYGSLIIDRNNSDPYIYDLHEGYCAIIPPKTYHYVHNDTNSDLKFFSIYSPPEFDDNHTDVILSEPRVSLAARSPEGGRSGSLRDVDNPS